jgi:chromatin segregation and condensation protein Rec8/ScpA/Scc1 (kleisin family)
MLKSPQNKTIKKRKASIELLERESSPARMTIKVHSSDIRTLRRAVKELKDSGKQQKVLQVRHKDLIKATETMKREGVSGTIKNITGTKRAYVGVERYYPKLSKTS